MVHILNYMYICFLFLLFISSRCNYKSHILFFVNCMKVIQGVFKRFFLLKWATTFRSDRYQFFFILSLTGGYPENPGPSPAKPYGLSRRDCATFPGFDHALCFAFRTDNSGPPMDYKVGFFL